MLAAMPKPLAHRHGGTFETSPSGAFGEVSIEPHQPQTLANPPFCRTGTGHAIDYSTIGGAALSASSTGRGGARNRADRESHALTVAQIANLKAAESHSRKIGLPFTRMITILWEAAGVPLEDMAKATGKFLDLLTRAFSRRGISTAWLWVHENGSNWGGHCHLLLHVPRELVPLVKRLQMKWLKRITGETYRQGVILSKPVGGRLGLERSNPELHAANVIAALSYHCKAAPQSALNRHGIDREHRPGGLVIGRRCSTSENIAAKARSEWSGLQ